MGDTNKDLGRALRSVAPRTRPTAGRLVVGLAGRAASPDRHCTQSPAVQPSNKQGETMPNQHPNANGWPPALQNALTVIQSVTPPLCACGRGGVMPWTGSPIWGGTEGLGPHRDPAAAMGAHAPISPTIVCAATTGWLRPANTSSVIASRSIASVFTRRRPANRRCSVTWAGLSSSTSQQAGHAYPKPADDDARPLPHPPSPAPTTQSIPRSDHNRSQIRAAQTKSKRAQHPTTASIGCRQHRRALADIDGNHNRGRRDWHSMMHRHNNTSGALPGDPRAATLRPQRNYLTVPS